MSAGLSPFFFVHFFISLWRAGAGDLEATVPKPGSDGTETLLDVERLYARDQGDSRI
jgi:hypothetical protein